jgi:hypothetical protein
VLALGRAVLAVSGAAKRVIAETQQGRLIGIGYQPNIAASATVAAIGSALGHVGFTTKTNAAGPTVASFGVQLRGINEVGHSFILRGGPLLPFAARHSSDSRR